MPYNVTNRKLTTISLDTGPLIFGFYYFGNLFFPETLMWVPEYVLDIFSKIRDHNWCWSFLIHHFTAAPPAGDPHIPEWWGGKQVDKSLSLYCASYIYINFSHMDHVIKILEWFEMFSFLYFCTNETFFKSLFWPKELFFFKKNLWNRSQKMFWIFFFFFQNWVTGTRAVFH